MGHGGCRLVGDPRASARPPGISGRTRGMKKNKIFHYCGLALEWGTRVLKFAYHALRFIGEVTNYRAQSI